MKERLTVGVIGASLQRGWASQSHIPAIRGLNELELAGVSGRTQEEADAAAEKFGASRGYASVDGMIADPSIDLITVAVRVPSHRRLLLKALQAGKHVYCEWPLGRDVKEAEELRDAAARAGVHVALGLQARRNPALVRAKALLEQRAIGRLLSARMYSSTVAFGSAEDEADTYLEDPANGATLLTIHGGHAVDSAIALLGPLASVELAGTTQYKQIDVSHGQRTMQRTIPDHLLLQGKVHDSYGVGIEVDGGRPASASRFRFEITGENGTMTLEGGAAVGFQAGRLSLAVNGTPELIEEGELAALPDYAVNVAAMYLALRDDINRQQRTVPDFEHAVRLTRLLQAAQQSADTGKRAEAADWPVA